MVHGDGNMTTDLVVDSYSTENTPDGTLTKIRLKDKLYPFYVDVNYLTYKDKDVIETWTEINHNEKNGVTLTQFSSGYLPVDEVMYGYPAFTGRGQMRHASWKNRSHRE